MKLIHEIVDAIIPIDAGAKFVISNAENLCSIEVISGGFFSVTGRNPTPDEINHVRQEIIEDINKCRLSL